MKKKKEKKKKKKKLSKFKDIYHIYLGLQGEKTIFEILSAMVLIINPFIPEFLKWTLPFLNLDMPADAKRVFSLES